MTIIGLDPHAATHTAVAMNSNGQELGSLTIPNTPDGCDRLRTWAAQFAERRWAIEGANRPCVRAFSHPLARHEWVVDVPPSLVSQYRSRRGARKNDRLDAGSAARACLANAQLPRFAPHPLVQDLKELSRARQQLASDLHSLKRSRARLSPDSPAAAPLDAAIACLQQQVEALDVACAPRVMALMPALLDQDGVGVVHAATLLAEVGDVARFLSKDAFASYCGCAPVERQSGGSRRAQVNLAGNRRLNRVLHMMVIVRLRHRARSRAYLARKVQEGKTKRSALRCLKTHVARELYAFMKETSRQRPYPDPEGA